MAVTRHPPLAAVCSTCGRKEWKDGRCAICIPEGRCAGKNPATCGTPVLRKTT